MQSLKTLARQLKQETYAIYLASQDPRVPWYARLLAAGIVAYALSPIDLIPDAIPIIGYLDDLVLVPLGIGLVLKMIPPEVMTDCRERAKLMSEKPTNWVVGGLIVALWVMLGIAIVTWLAHLIES